MQTALRTSEIEGEKLDAASVRSSVVRHLGLEQAGFVDKHVGFTGTLQTEALVQLLIDATSNVQQPVSQNTLIQWQAALFPDTPKLQTLHTPVLKSHIFIQSADLLRSYATQLCFAIPAEFRYEVSLECVSFQCGIAGLDLTLSGMALLKACECNERGC